MKKILLFSAALLSVGMMSAKVDYAAERAIKPSKVTLTEAPQRVNMSKMPFEIAPMTAKSSIVSEKNLKSTLKDTEVLSALYDIPGGTFYWGWTKDWGSYGVPNLIGPAYSEMTFSNLSTAATSYNWSYINPNEVTGTVSATSTDKDLKVTYPATIFTYTKAIPTVPSLTASQADGTNKTYFVKSLNSNVNYKGKQGKLFNGVGATYDMEEYLGVTATDYSQGTTTYYSGAVGDWWFGTGATAKGLGVVGMGTYFRQPEASYALDSIFVAATYFKAAADAEFTAKVYSVDGEGNLSELATGTCLTTDTIQVIADPTNGDYVTLPFALKKVDPATGLSEEVSLTIDTPILVEFTGYQSDKVQSFALRVNSQGQDVPSYTGYFVTEKDGAKGYTPIAKWFTSPLYAAPSIFMNIMYTWMNCDDFNYAAPNEGGSHTFTVDSFYYPAAWTIAEAEDGTLPDWVTYELSEDKTTGLSMMKVTAAALPAGVAGRTATLTVSIPGTTKVFKVIQGNGSVAGVEVSPITVSVAGGNFDISYPANITSVNIYNVSGQLVESANLEGGKTTISGDGMAKGLYILKFNDNTTVKAIK